LSGSLDRWTIPAGAGSSAGEQGTLSPLVGGSTPPQPTPSPSPGPARKGPPSCALLLGGDPGARQQADGALVVGLHGPVPHDQGLAVSPGPEVPGHRPP